jgi:photosystem II stability/assembly factor-like uncharacterized protein
MVMKSYILTLAIFSTTILPAQTWTVLNSGVAGNVLYLSFPSNDTGYAVGDSGSMRKTTNGGANWSSVPAPGGAISVFFITGNKGFTATNGSIHMTVNGGSNWTIPYNEPANFHPVGFHFPDAQNGFFTAFNMTVDSILIYKTVNGGTSWTFCSRYRANAYLTPMPYFVDATTGFMEASGEIFRTMNSGTTFSSVYNTAANFDYFSQFQFMNPDSGFALTNLTDLLRTTDGGTTWTANSLPGIGLHNGMHFFNMQHGFVCGGNGFNSGAIMETFNAGANWSPAYTSTMSFYCMDFPSSSTGYVGADGSMVVKYTNSSPNDVAEFETGELSIYPNPAAGFITIGNVDPGAEIHLMDLEGRVIRSVVAASGSCLMDVGGIASGVYIIEVREGEFIRKEKVIVR